MAVCVIVFTLILALLIIYLPCKTLALLALLLPNHPHQPHHADLELDCCVRDKAIVAHSTVAWCCYSDIRCSPAL